ncbi:5-deoxy-glucuronate isomerase [Streptomyces sp. NPDC048603]|uniref:5-deoxy-glucuronate isomerase n=1 Tax=Streptomyces sp. NPDC048603 TaxID=3365577 RepID=UPI00372257CC
MPVTSEHSLALSLLRILDLGPGETYAFECGDAEWIVLPLSGGCTVRCTEPMPHPALPLAPPGGPPSRNRGSAPDPAAGAAPPDPARGCAPDPTAGSAPHPARGSALGISPGSGAGGGSVVFELAGRGSVFEATTDFAYVPRDAEVEVWSAEGGRFALAGARCERRLPARYGAGRDVAVELRGRGACSRQVNNFAAADAFACDRLIAVEVLTPGGNWSSYPPHKHDEQCPGEESELEEIYWFEIAPHGATPGVGYQRVTPSPAGKTDVLAEVRSGDAVLIPDGWHGPSIAAPGHDMYYLNVMAGPGAVREWLIRDHPEHAWIRESWEGQPVDPRLPFHRAEEARR